MNTIEIETDFCGMILEVHYFYTPARPAEGSAFPPSEHYVPAESSYVTIRDVYLVRNVWKKDDHGCKILVDSSRHLVPDGYYDEDELHDIVLEEHEDMM